MEAIHARYQPRLPVPTKLEPYKPLIQARLTEFPALQATRLFAEFRAAGYPGGYSQLCESLVLTPRPAPVPKARSLPLVVVERRRLRTYAALVGAEP